MQTYRPFVLPLLSLLVLLLVDARLQGSKQRLLVHVC